MKTSTATPSARFAIVARIAVALLGGYAFCWGFIGFGVSGLYSLGVSFHEAESLSTILALLIYLVVFLWVFAARHLARTAVLLFGGGALMAGIASLLQSQLTR